MNTSSPPASEAGAPRAALLDALKALDAALAASPCARTLVGTTDGDLLAFVSEVEAVARRADALRVAAAAEVAERSRRSLGSDGLAARQGCRDANELVRRLTGVSARTAARRIGIGEATRVRTSLLGHARPARFEHVAAALSDGLLGLDSAAAVIDGLAPIDSRCNPDHVRAAESELVAAASGGDVEGCSADETRLQAAVWRAVLDPDGVEPAEEKALVPRGIRLGRERNGSVGLSARLTAPVAAQLRKLFDAYANPKTAPRFLSADEATTDREGDTRTPDQQRHDAFAAMIDHAGRCAETPTLGGQAPAVIVTVAESELRTSAYSERSPDECSTDERSPRRKAGVGFIEGVSTPVALATVDRFACSGGLQRVVLNDEGGIVELGSVQRCFTPQQRRVISMRDGGCIVPGCGIPAAWCEVHHVHEHADGGETHPDNGVLLCWFHHRTLETSGWQIRIRERVPEIKPPPWLGRGHAWRPAAQSAHHRHMRVKRRLRHPPEGESAPG